MAIAKGELHHAPSHVSLKRRHSEVDAARGLVFPARIRLVASKLQTWTGEKPVMQPGMAATVEIVTGVGVDRLSAAAGGVDGGTARRKMRA